MFHSFIHSFICMLLSDILRRKVGICEAGNRRRPLVVRPSALTFPRRIYLRVRLRRPRFPIFSTRRRPLRACRFCHAAPSAPLRSSPRRPETPSPVAALTRLVARSLISECPFPPITRTATNRYFLIITTTITVHWISKKRITPVLSTTSRPTTTTTATLHRTGRQSRDLRR